MNLELLQKIFTAIKNDDLQSFSEIVEARRSVLSIAFGRFPILSVCYLFQSTTIITAFERDLMAVINYTEVDELNQIYHEFKKHAKKCLRLYLEIDSIVSPLEMLAIINNAYILRKVYAKYPKDNQISKRISDIYRILHGQKIRQEDNLIYIKRQKLKKKQLSIILTIITLAVFVSGLFGGLYGFTNVYYGKGTENNPIILRRDAQLITALNKGGYYYKLDNDMVISQPINTDFDGYLDGNGHTISIEHSLDASLIGNLTGSISNLNFSFGNQELIIEDDFGVLLTKNNGNIINVNIDIVASIKEEVDKDELYVSIMCVDNSGIILDSNVNADINFVGNGKGNAYLSAFAAINNGTINRCHLLDTAIFVTDTVDIGGIVAENGENGEILYCKNSAKLEQDTLSTEWNPNCAGIAMINNGLISNCFNQGDIIASSGADNANCAIFLGGIVAINNSKISKSKNNATLKVISRICAVYLGGITSVNSGASSVVESSGVEGVMLIESPSDSSYMFGGGLVGTNYGTVKDCFFIGQLNSDNEIVLNSYIVGLAQNVSFSNNIALIRENIPYPAILIRAGMLYYTDEGCTIVETIDEIKSSEVYW